jgi:hypothetical protein
MKTITLAATLSALVPGKMNGVSARATTTATRTEREPAVARQVVGKNALQHDVLP